MTLADKPENAILRTQASMETTFLADTREGNRLALLVACAEDLANVAELYGLAPDEIMQALEGALHAALDDDQEAQSYVRGDRLVALVRGTDLDRATRLAGELIRAAHRLPIPGRKRPVRLSLAGGLAENRPDFELYFRTLIDVAEEGLSVARGRGGECCVHTMLYGLLQTMAERNVAQAEEPEPERAALPTGTATRTEIRRANPAPTASTTPTSTSTPTHTPTSLDDRAEELAREQIAALRADFEERLIEARGQLASAGGDGDVENLQRRVAKLTASLERAEAQILKLARMKNVDVGLSSIYREVQGLSADDANFEAKKDMMKNIFEANLALQQRLVG